MSQSEQGSKGKFHTSLWKTDPTNKSVDASIHLLVVYLELTTSPDTECSKQTVKCLTGEQILTSLDIKMWRYYA